MRAKAVAAAIVVALLGAVGVALAAPSNGGFEKGNFRGWDVTDPGGGDWYVYKNRDLPPGPDAPPPPRGLGGGPFFPPPKGEFAAGAYQRGPGLNILHRRLRLRGGADQLSFYLAWDNSQSRFYTPDSFDYGGGAGRARGMGGGGESNQQFRIDVLKAGAPVDTLNDGKILATLFKVRRNTRDRRRYKQLSFDLSQEGVDARRVQFRVAEVDNRGELLVGVDHVKLKRD